MANRKERRFIVKEMMRQSSVKNRKGFGYTALSQICKPKHYDGVNEQYRSFFAMHWRNFPNLDIIPIVQKKHSKHTKRNLNVKRKEAMA